MDSSDLTPEQLRALTERLEAEGFPAIDKLLRTTVSCLSRLSPGNGRLGDASLPGQLIGIKDNFTVDRRHFQTVHRRSLSCRGFC